MTASAIATLIIGVAILYGGLVYFITRVTKSKGKEVKQAKKDETGEVETRENS